jgi:hypothetical protein
MVKRRSFCRILRYQTLIPVSPGFDLFYQGMLFLDGLAKAL